MNADGTGEWYLHLFAPEQPDLNWDHPEVRRRVRGHPAVLVRPRRRRHPHRLGRAAASRTRRCPTRRRGPSHRPAPVRRPGRAARDLPRLARDRRRATPATRILVGEVVAARPERLRPLPAPGRAAHGVQLRLPRARRGTPARCGRHRRDARRARAGRRARHLGAVQPRRDPPRHPLRARGHRVRVRGQAARHPTDLELGTRRARAAALLTLALPGAVYIYQGEELGLPEVEDLPRDRVQDPMYFRSGGADPGRDGCRVPLPGRATRRRSASRRRRAGRGCRSRPTGPSCPRTQADRTRSCRSTGTRCGSGGPSLSSKTGPCDG